MINSAWSDEELFDSVKAYAEMLYKERKGEKYIKKEYYRELSEKYGRTEKAFEYRMQNISHVRSLMELDWVQGLKPAKNVGDRNITKIKKMLLDINAND